MTIRPSSGVSKPAISRNSVVLPQPEGPSSAKNSPASIASDTRSTAAMAPNRLLAPMISRTGMSRSAARFQMAPGAGAQALIGARRRQVDIQKPAHRLGRIDAGVVADLGIDQRGRRRIRVRLGHRIADTGDHP